MRLLEWHLVAGDLRWVPEMRALMHKALPGCPRADDVEVVTSELAANAVLHTASGNPGGRFGVALYERDPRGGVEVRVHDEGGPTVPCAAAASPGLDDLGDLANAGAAEPGGSGRGLMLVDALADNWGYVEVTLGRYVWAAFDVPESWSPAEAGTGGQLIFPASLTAPRSVTRSTTVASALCGPVRPSGPGGVAP